MKIAIWLLRAGLAFTFFYAAISGFIQPDNWIGWLPELIRQPVFLNLFGILEIIVGFWLLSGWQSFWAGIISGAMLSGIVVFNFGAMLIVFRDIGLALAAFALAFLTRE